MSGLSTRARQLAAHPSPLVVAHFRAVADPWHATENPDGVINFGTAENFLLWDLVSARLARAPPLSERDVHYGKLHGRTDTREALAGYLSTLLDAPVAADELVLASGVSAVLDHVATILCDPGEGVLLPAPYYSGFDGDLGTRAQARIVPVHPADGFDVAIGDFQRALDEARRGGIAVRAVLLCSPNNPLGSIYPESLLRGVLDFVRRERLHLVCDEIYAGSVFGDAAFTSVRKLAPDREDVHVVYGLAKDLGLSGLKVGMLQSRSREVIAAAQGMALFAPVSTSTQQLVRWLVSDAEFISGLRRANRERLGASYARLAGELDRAEIPHRRPEAGVFAWLDLRQWLEVPTVDGELALYQRLLDRGRVNVSPGAAFHCREPGWFRLCHAQKPGVVEEGGGRLARVLASSRED